MTSKMTRNAWICLAALQTLVAVTSAASERIVLAESAPPLQRMAGSEVRRYVYLRTGRMPTVTTVVAVRDDAVVVACKDHPLVTEAVVKTAAENLKAQEFILKTTASANGKKTWWIVGGDDTGVLYGAYRFAERLGVRFYLHGDVVPDERLASVPDMDETGKPLFALRGLNPWGSHPFGFDAWSADDYKAVFSQLAKMRMNFLGIHCYPEGHPYAEPTVWLGTPDDFDEQGNVKFSYPSHYYNTLVKGVWGPMLPKKTSDYRFGAAQLFEDDAWAPNVMRGHCPAPETPAGCNELFNRMAAQFKDAFGFARLLGVKTCVGTEAPMIMPKALQERLKSQGRIPTDPAVVRQVYEGMFRRIAASHPLDYFWIWTPEGWTWGGNKPEQYAQTVNDIKLAIEALKNVNAPFQLATCGWVLGPQHNRAAFDQDMPKDVAMSAISRNTGATPVDAAFKEITGRGKWAIPWLESDNREGLAAVQLFVGRMRRDAADARAYGCDGLMGLQWRTDHLAPNASALALAAWDQSGWNPAPAGAPAPSVAGGPLGGQTASYPAQQIGKTDEPEPYRTCRYGMDGYNLQLPNGRYRVTLKFCEPHFDKAGERIGDFKLQEKTVLDGLDIFARAGKFTALDLTFDDIEVKDGWLRLRVEARKSLPCISAIVAEGPAGKQKINCGGPAWSDYAADVESRDADSKRPLPCEDFYLDWAKANFGLEEIGRLFAKIDGQVPQVSDGGCPSGSLTPVKKPWADVAPRFAFVDEYEAFRPRVSGKGNLERFDYWLNLFQYLRALEELRCVLAGPDAAAIARLYADAYRHLLATVNTPGGLAMVVNMECHPGWGQSLARHAAQPWPGEYPGAPRLTVTTVRSQVLEGEALKIKATALDRNPVKRLELFWRPLGNGEFRKVAPSGTIRSVHRFDLPAATEDFEYYLEAVTADGTKRVWPATAPEMNQTVIVLHRR